jgi:syringomycin synthetase protein SyrB1
VVGRDHGEGDKTLAAYVVATTRRESLIEELRALSNAHLPAHLCPSSYVLLDELPLTTNGKVDASRLPAPEQPSAQRVAVEKRLPVSRIEKTLAEIWQRVLRVARVGLDDDFFELGGTSLGAVKVLLSIKEQLGVALDMSLWADVSTVAGFAGACSALRHASSTRSQTSFESPVSPGEMR